MYNLNSYMKTRTPHINNHLPAVFEEKVLGVTVKAVLDTRRMDSDRIPIVIRSTFKGKRHYELTGKYTSMEKYLRLADPTCRRTNEETELRQAIRVKFNLVISAINDTCQSHFDTLAIRNRLSTKPVSETTKTFCEYWKEFGDSRPATKTKALYHQARVCFYKYLGCRNEPLVFADGTVSQKRQLSGKALALLPEAVTARMIAGWEEWMLNGDAKAGRNKLSATAVSMYLRCVRAVLRELTNEDGLGMFGTVLKSIPKVIVRKGDRRKMNFLEVVEVLKIRDYNGTEKLWADWWVMLYLMNGANLRDVATLRWGADCWKNRFPELHFVRSKTSNRVKVDVFIPVTPLLYPYLERYATKPLLGELVFPQILLSAETSSQIDSRVHDFNGKINTAMTTVCQELGIVKACSVSPATARNTYVTTLTRHGVNDAFIDSMLGHADRDVLDGYQGGFSDSIRYKNNMLLFTEPETKLPENEGLNPFLEKQ